MNIAEVTKLLEDFAPLNYQESYDNCGLLTGNKNDAVTGVLLCTDITLEVLYEAVDTQSNLIIAHHPVIFKPLHRLTGSSYAEQCVIFAIQHNLAIYSAHTNFDMVFGGVSYKMAEKLGLQQVSCLAPVNSGLNKLICYVPHSHAEQVRMAMFKAGAGNIGNYDCCSFNLSGTGTYRAGETAKPFTGEIGQLHSEPEIRIETIVEDAGISRVIGAMISAHPYEEVAYDIIPLKNINNKLGLGALGILPKELNSGELIAMLKDTFGCDVIKIGPIPSIDKPIRKIAVCGGSGSSLINKAIASGADVYITGEIGYHHYFTGNNNTWLIDIGHYESEQFTKEIFYDLISKINPKFAVRFSNINTNPIKFI